MKKRKQKIAALFLSAMMALNAASPAVPEITMIVAEAEETEGIETIFDINLDDGTTCNFDIYKEGGESSLSNENGELVVNITNCGEVNYANQIYWEGFELREGCQYKFSFDVHGSIKRKIGYRIQLNGGNYQAYDSKRVDVKTDVNHIESVFTMTKASDPAPRLCFNMGLQSNMKEDPGEHQVYLDNIQLVLIDDSNAVDRTEEERSAYKINVDQVGYRPSDVKFAVASAEYANSECSIVDVNTGESVYTVAFGKSMNDKSTKQEISRADFTEMVSEGTYKIVTNDGTESPEFTIAENIFDDLFRDTFRMMYYQRCGVELTEDLAGEYAHPVCHDMEAVIYGTDVKKDVSGGWHDAGDYGRYSVTAAKTAADLLFAYEDNKENPMVLSDDLGIPESGNGIPDILDEVKFELDWFLKMQDEESGGVYHKVSCYNFPGTVMPQNEIAELVLAPIALTSTGDFAAIMAKAAVDYAEIDAEASMTYLNAAIKAWEFIENNKKMRGFTNPPEISTGEYGDGSAKDEIYWAAVELYLAGQALGVETIEISEIPSDGSTGLGWVDVGAYGVYELAKAEAVNDDLAKLSEAAKEKLIKKADNLKSNSENDGYYVSIGNNYWWGSNMEVANSGMILVMANKLTEDAEYQITAQKQLDYLLGVNGLGQSYISGFGSNPMADPHHRPSQFIGKAVPGMLAGGPNSGREDPYAKQVLNAISAPALCYVDNQQSYSTNEVAIYWNSPLVNLIAGI